jgi:CheY-like chemotaxis protein
MIRETGLTSEQLENLHIISRSGEHLLNLINDVLEMSKIEAGRVTVTEQNVDLSRMLDDLENMFHLRAVERGLLLTFVRDANVPQVIRMDEGKLRQVLINLLSNAVKFTPQGSIKLTVRMQSSHTTDEPPGTHRVAHTAAAADDDGLSFDFDLPAPPKNTPNPAAAPQKPIEGETYRLHFSVEDTGVGIGEDELANLFEEFVQTRSGQQAQEGTGLGLPISRHFVRLLGGDITVHSKVGRGTVFFFDIPFKLPEAGEFATSQPSSRRVVSLAPDQPVYRILVVEDDWTNRKLLTRLLQAIGFDVREAINGQEAIDLWKHWNPHLIWMDMRMPILDGYEATRQIKAHTAGGDTVIIALTASAFEEQRSVALAAGCNDFVRKPFSQSLIFDKMKEHLNVRFVYEDEVAEAAEEHELGHMGDAVSLDALATLPEPLVQDLHFAASVADIDRIGELIDQIRQHNTLLADVLTDLTHNFRLDQIVSWTSGRNL